MASTISCKKDNYVTIDKTNTAIAIPHFVGDQACVNCHSKEYDLWKGSHHDQAMKIADSNSVLGNFNNITFTYKGGKATFFKKDTSYFVNIKGPDNAYHDYEIKYTFGFTPLQQYIAELDNGKFQCLTIAWDSNQNKWFNLYPDLEIATNERIHWTGEAMRWNNACADCHSTDLKKNYTPETEAYHTTFKYINVNCEACHGPAGDHVNHYSKGETEAYVQKLLMTSSTTAKQLVDECARCHSRRSQITADFTHNEGFHNHYMPTLLSPPLYKGDGQIEDEVYVYGSFTQSKMYQNGVSCRDCHNPHSLQLKATGNQLCLNCHEPAYNTPQHHNHTLGTDAALCINCHMTGKYYMQNDFRRDHSFRIPRPDQSVAYGTPNACNNCHTDKSAEWAVNSLKAWGATKAMDAKSHYSDYLLAGYAGDKQAFQYIIDNHNYPDIIRATALQNYTNMNLTPQEVNGLKKYLKDSSIMVKTETLNAYFKIGDTTQTKAIAKLLTDSLRSARILSAKFISVYGAPELKTESFKKANKEFETFLNTNADFSSGQAQIAEYKYLKNDVEGAIKAYEKAVAYDDYNNNARLSLAYLYYQKGNIKKAGSLYQRVIELQPDNSYPYYMLGLLLNEAGKDDATLKYLGEACKREPFNLRAFYNYAVKLQEKSKFQQSIEVLDKALEQAPDNSDLLYVKLIALMQLKKYTPAQKVCQQLIVLNPYNNNFKQLLAKIEQEKKTLP
ncbi:tetratricopeptide repeat protein [Neptunitalea lumnitzerae]|uniref:Uncharacterized protein n=1 Tax=Neptunitalea lumnitzerae TaxID=2965509 RepID=A0ABQ5MKF1_9FLAO|nr:tetratricopeptide repeat protein [Neptunitalea sp. Y10]GLB49874.1 hypothetical protein Y10_22420 [Neptunitalea sp. Y10]